MKKIVNKDVEDDYIKNVVLYAKLCRKYMKELKKLSADGSSINTDTAMKEQWEMIKKLQKKLKL